MSFHIFNCCIYLWYKESGCTKCWRVFVYLCRYDSRDMFFSHEDLNISRDTFLEAFFSFKSSKIKPKELSIFKMLQIFRVNITAIQSKLAAALFLTLICFIEERMICVFKLVMNFRAILHQITDKDTGSMQLHI